MGNSDLSPSSVMTVKITGRVLTATVILLFLMLIFAVFLYVYARNTWIPRIFGHGRAHFSTTAGDAPVPPVPRQGLESEALRSLPVSVFRRSDFKDGIECSICLTELSEGEKVRLLPKCKHGFHLDCINMWLHSHFTCPICRCPVGPVAAAAGEVSLATAGERISSELPALPINVLIWRNNGRFSTRGLAHSHRSLVITIPNQFADGLPSPISPLGSNRSSGQNFKSPVEELRSPGTSKFGSLSRILSRGKSTGGSSCSSPVEGDIEQGLVRCGVVKGEGTSNVPKTPIST
ncbi:hypothetical protein IEQ34_019037 [Dendrobium chrysotoxum]|uniref:RING-type E3 ubiquitin transferase n=1 Tax=Dendrobium chrysotoxum TaxID=161865 RepID=A0AAV7G7K1_DENCH|nr:hypothetical protein IEQ34_019037 [Dendrobium chrysotoxum]